MRSLWVGGSCGDVGHRPPRRLAEAQENTLPAFERAIELGADFVELDVQASSDGVLVVFHDLRLDRLRSARAAARPSAAELPDLGNPTLPRRSSPRGGRVGVMAELKTPYRYRRDVSSRARSLLLGCRGRLVSFSRRALREAARPARAARRAARRLRLSIRAAAGLAGAPGSPTGA